MDKEPVNMDGINVEWLCDRVGKYLQFFGRDDATVRRAVDWMMLEQSPRAPASNRNRVNLTKEQAEVILVMCRITHPLGGP